MRKVRHYKGGVYQVLGTALNAENDQEMILYTDGFKLYCRSEKNFNEEVQFNGKQVKRFMELNNEVR